MRQTALTATLRDPEAIRNLCGALASVNRNGIFHINDNHTRFSAINEKRSFQLWIDLVTETALEDCELAEETWLQVHFDSFSKMFRSYDGMSEVGLRVSCRSEVSRYISLRLDQANYDGDAEMSVRQRMGSRALSANDAPEEPITGHADIYCEIKASQFPQMLRVSEKYRQMDNHVTLKASRRGVLTMLARPEAVEVTSTWLVDLPDLLSSQQQSQQTSWSSSPSQPWRVSQPDSPSNSQGENAPEALGSNQTNQALDQEAEVTISSKDWCSTLSALALGKRVVLGITTNSLVSVYCYLREGTDDDFMTFYLSANS